MSIEDVEVLDGTWSAERPCIVFDAALAQQALDEDNIIELVEQGLQALALSGKNVVVLQAYDTL